MESVANKQLNKGSVFSKSFIYGHKNTIEKPYDFKKIKIDDKYLTSNNKLLMDIGKSS